MNEKFDYWVMELKYMLKIISAMTMAGGEFAWY